MANRRETELPTDLVAGLLMADASAPRACQGGDRLTLKTYAVMAVTTALTFATLTTGYSTLFTQSVFA